MAPNGLIIVINLLTIHPRIQETESIKARAASALRSILADCELQRRCATPSWPFERQVERSGLGACELPVAKNGYGHRSIACKVRLCTNERSQHRNCEVTTLRFKNGKTSGLFAWPPSFSFFEQEAIKKKTMKLHILSKLH